MKQNSQDIFEKFVFIEFKVQKIYSSKNIYKENMGTCRMNDFEKIKQLHAS